MPVADILEKDFIGFITQPIVKFPVEYENRISQFKRNLRDISFRIRGESRNDSLELLKQNPIHGRLFFTDMIGKIDRTIKDLYETREDGLYYIHNNANIKLENGNKTYAPFAIIIYNYCLEIKSILESRVQEINELDNPKPIIAIQKTKIFSKKPRQAKRQSFELNNSNANLQLAHKILIDNKLIDATTSFDNFSKVFSGEPVFNKVIWNRTNCLHYFIKGIIAGGGVKKPNNGKWNRTINCFATSKRHLEIIDLKNTKPPVLQKTLKLDDAISAINFH